MTRSWLSELPTGRDGSAPRPAKASVTVCNCALYCAPNGSATVAHGDYVAQSGTLTFAAGTTSQTITVSVNGGTTTAANENFFVNLSSPANATIATAQGVGTITNVTGEVQRLKRAVNTMGAKPDLEIMGFIARDMGVAAALGPWKAEVVFEEIRAQVRRFASEAIARFIIAK